MRHVASPRAHKQGTRHADRVYSVVDGVGRLSQRGEFSASWERSIRKYGLDPAAEPVPRVLTSVELREQLEPVEALIRSASGEIDRFYNAMRVAGYAVLLSNSNGVAVDLRGEVMPATHLKDLGSCVGGVWSEEVHGTNGIGTCVAEERPITVHRTQHFRSRHTHLSCSGAPIFGLDGRLMAVLDVSSVDPRLSERAHALTGTLTTAATRAIEERFFREQFRHQWVVATSSQGDGGGGLLAVDGDQRIVGANRAARASFSLDDQKLRNGISLWEVFKLNADLFGARHGGDFFVQLATLSTDEIGCAVMTPPYNGRAGLILHARPRLDLLDAMTVHDPLPPVHGGLSPVTLRRVRTYIEKHLTERIQLADLAAAAGLSVYHFAREFKRSVGVSPHFYVTRLRVEKAQELLGRTDLPLSDVALVSGFFDQSHLARRFREFVGATPAEYRWSQR